MQKKAHIDSPNGTSLTPVIKVDDQKCVNCHACISVCPVKFCNDGSGDFVVLNPHSCIGCGNCLKACTHGARLYQDDFSEFMNDVGAGEKMIAIVAPSIAANFPKMYLNMNGWLRHLGVKAIFDVSFGAELTVKSYLDVLSSKQPETMIAQPCPALVTYMEVYKPELLPYLAPVDSPMLHTMKMIREFYKEYDDHKIVVISPCLAKKREFVETGYGDYNVGYITIEDYFKENNIDLSTFPEWDYDNPPAERAVLFSSPGGLMRTAERWVPDIRERTRKIEGVPTVYEYMEHLFEMIDTGKSPLLIDCLNCEHGCNGGTLTIRQDQSVDEIEYWIEQRNKEMQKLYAEKAKDGTKSNQAEVAGIVNMYWKPGLYERTYMDRSVNITLKTPTEEELQEIFHSMHKYSDDDIYNCSACGYNACEKMAYAIFNGLNKPENCHFYLSRESEIAHNELLELNTTLEEKVKERTSELQEKNELIMDSINYAQRIQNAILPWESKLKDELKDYFILFKPKDVLSGDFYWFHSTGEHIFIAAVDCTGHGIPGSMVSMIGYMLLNEIVKERRIIDPGTILDNLHTMTRTVLHQTTAAESTDDGMDICFCRINKTTDEMVFAGAKRPLYLVRDNKLRVVKGDRYSIGGEHRDKTFTFNNHKVELVKGDMLYLTTDGLFDQANSNWRRFGSRRFKEILPKLAREYVENQKDILMHQVSKHLEGQEMIDDITVIGLKMD